MIANRHRGQLVGVRPEFKEIGKSQKLSHTQLIQEPVPCLCIGEGEPSGTRFDRVLRQGRDHSLRRFQVVAYFVAQELSPSLLPF